MITPHCGDRRAEFPFAFDFFGIVFRRDNRDIQSSNPLVATKGIHGAYRLGYSEGMLQQTGGALNNTIGDANNTKIVFDFFTMPTVTK